MVCFPLIISQPWPYWCCFSFFICYLFILSKFCYFHLFKVCKKPNRDYGSLKFAVNNSKCLLLWENIRKNKSLCINLSLKERGKLFKSLSRMLCFSLLPPSFSIRSRYDSNWYVRGVSASWFRIWIPMDARTGSWISDEPFRRMGVSKPYRWFSNGHILQNHSRIH